MIKEEITQTVEAINRVFSRGHYPAYIEYIRFPFFKNLKPDSRINFDFPFTVLTGLNGSGKSSALHAIYGSPEGYSTGQYWFSTDLDPIRDEKGNPPAFIYGYKGNNGDTLEVLKTRVGSSKGADYWEPSRPIKRYGMSKISGGRRNPAISKQVIYLDFRAELSAFDKFFYFGNFIPKKTLKTKQDYLRRYTRNVKFALDCDCVTTMNSRSNSLPNTLNETVVRDIATILGKPYDECKLVDHNFYAVQGSTILFQTSNAKYSEAFAGRGEYAVVKLVHKIYEAPHGALIILDEPEVSLHPGAQELLKLFLLKKCLEKKLQIVISSHAPKLVEWLPEGAIKLFYQENDGKFSIKNNCSYFEAFENIGIEINDGSKKTIILEDITAKEIVDAVINDIGRDFPLLLATK